MCCKSMKCMTGGRGLARGAAVVRRLARRGPLWSPAYSRTTLAWLMYMPQVPAADLFASPYTEAHMLTGTHTLHRHQGQADHKRMSQTHRGGGRRHARAACCAPWPPSSTRGAAHRGAPAQRSRNQTGGRVPQLQQRPGSALGACQHCSQLQLRSIQLGSVCDHGSERCTLTSS